MLDYIRYQEKRQSYLTAIERRLDQLMQQDQSDEYGRRVVEAARYYLMMEGSKRVRPLLMMAAAEYFGVKPEMCLTFAVASELIHNYSLIHDDLPGIDDADTRRGRTSCHRRYGQGYAILAGDYLLNKAYELILEEAGNSRAHLAAVRQLAKAAGLDGLISGQSIDIQTTLPPFESKVRLTNEQRESYFKTMLVMDQRKTGALISVPLLIPATLAEARMEEFVTMTRLGQRLGLAFQVKDDILDADEDRMSPSNFNHTRLTVVRLFGLKNATIYYESVCREVRESYNSLNKLDGRADFLMTLIEDLLQRQA